jgi:hypothetical protein
MSILIIESTTHSNMQIIACSVNIVNIESGQLEGKLIDAVTAITYKLVEFDFIILDIHSVAGDIVTM